MEMNLVKRSIRLALFITVLAPFVCFSANILKEKDEKIIHELERKIKNTSDKEQRTLYTKKTRRKLRALRAQQNEQEETKKDQQGISNKSLLIASGAVVTLVIYRSRSPVIIIDEETIDEEPEVIHNANLSTFDVADLFDEVEEEPPIFDPNALDGGVPQVIHDANPYTFDDPYKFHNINWEESTLDPKAIEDLNDDRPNIRFSKEKGKHAWPAYMTMKILGRDLYNIDEAIKVCYKDPRGLLTPDQIVEEVKATKDSVYFFHAVPSVRVACSILKSELKVGYSRLSPGAFVAAGKIARVHGEAWFGSIILGYKRELEFNFPLTHREYNYNNYWVGLWGPIQREYLAEIFIDDRQMSAKRFNRKKKKIEDTLKRERYDPQVKVSRYVSLEIRGKGKRYLSHSRIAIPICWLSGNDTRHGVTFQRTKEHVLQAHKNTDMLKFKHKTFINRLKKLDKDEKLPII